MVPTHDAIAGTMLLGSVKEEAELAAIKGGVAVQGVYAQSRIIHALKVKASRPLSVAERYADSDNFGIF